MHHDPKLSPTRPARWRNRRALVCRSIGVGTVYADLVNAALLLAQLQDECGQSLDDGIHLITVQREDWTLVVGDSHHPHDSAEPSASDAVDRRILHHLREVVELAECEVLERWTGAYPPATAPTA